ncbi:MAG: IPT/TIG domain-containing protein [Planctomycetota bacterium]
MRTFALTTLLLGGGLLCGASVVQAAPGAKPVIERIQYSTGKEVQAVPVGGTIYIIGRDLYEPPEMQKDEKTGRPKPGQDPWAGLTVTIDGTKCVILASSLSQITVQVHPTVKPGKRKTVEVTVSGRGSAKTHIDVITQEEFSKADKGGEKAGETGTNDRENLERGVMDSFQITKFSMVSGGAGQTFTVEGTATKVPDELRVQLSLMFDKREILSRAVPIKDGKFSATFGPYTEKLLVGNYAVEMVFALNKQSRVRMMSWLRKLSKDEQAIYKRIVRRGYTSVGGSGPEGQITPEDRAKQQEELKVHCVELTDALQKLMDQLAVCYAGAGRSFFKKASSAGFEEALYLKWLTDNGYAKDDEAAKKILRDTTYGSGGGHFQDRAWEAFGREKLIPGLQELYDKHVKFNKQYIAPPDSRVERLGEYLISNVAQLFEKWTLHLYTKSKLTIPDTIKEMPFQVISAPQTSIKFFAAKRRELLKIVGVDVPG